MKVLRDMITNKLKNYLTHVLPFTPYPYKGYLIDCPSCKGKGSNISNMDRKLKSLPTSLCNDCGLFFTNPMPTEAELSEYYKFTYRSTYVHAFNAPPEAHIVKKKKDAEVRAELILRLFENSKGLKSLDFGCGLGELVNSLQQRGFDSYGFEPGEIWSKHLDSPNIKQGSWNTVDYPDHSFDFVSIIHVLEHLRSPVECLVKIEKQLKDDGLLWIEVPDMQVYGTKNHKRFHFAHVLGFSRENLINTALKSGFYPIRDISKQQINKKRSQISIIFRKIQQNDQLDLALHKTALKNREEYGNFSIIKHSINKLIKIFDPKHLKNKS